MQSEEVIAEIEKRLISACNIVENEVFRDWFTENLTDEDSQFERLFEPNMDTFQKVFGQHQFSFTLDKQYMVWRLLMGQHKLYCISHQGGTFYEVFYSSSRSKFNEDEKIGRTIITFIEFIMQKLTLPS